MSPSPLWYLTRGSGVVSLLLLTVVVLLGVAGTFRWRSARVPRFLVAGLHRNLTLLALAFLVVHVVTTVLDSFAPIGLKDALIPFVSAYRPFWLGLGALAFDLLLALVATSLLRARVGLRLWRGLHWLAYAAWPVALVHALGTGSDAKVWWLQGLAFVSTAAVALAVVARAAANLRDRLSLRLAAIAGAVLVPLGILVWATGGPLAPGWARRAGTPATLLGGGTRLAAATHAIAATALPSPPFDAALRGRVSESQAGGGLVRVGIDATTSGGAAGVLRVTLTGLPLRGGGVEMTGSRATFGPAAAPSAYAGRIVRLDGSRMLLALQSSSGRPLDLDVRLDVGGGGAVGGAVRAVAADGEGA